MTILHILDHSLPVQSGYAFRSHSILRAQQKSGLGAVALTSPKHYESDLGPHNEVDTIEGVAYYRTPPVSKSQVPLASEVVLMLRLKRSLDAFIAEQRPTVLHPHSPTLNVIPAIVVGKRARIPVVYEMRSSWEDAAADRGTYGPSSWKYRVGRRLETWACRNSDAVVVICEGLKQELITRGIPSSKITVVPNGVDVDLFNAAQEAKISGHALGLQGRKVIGFMGSFFKWEGLDMLLDAMAVLAKRRPDVSLLLVGSGEMRGRLEKKIHQLNLEQHICMPGTVPQAEIPSLYALVDVMAFPRYPTRLTEMVTPLKPLEAMAMGKAVVASDVGGHKELVQHGETGLLFKAGEVTDLVCKLSEVLENGELCHRLAAQGLDWVRRERDWNRTTQPYHKVYASVRSPG